MRTEVPRRPVIAVFVKGLGIGGAEKLIAEGSAHWDRTAFDYRVAYVLPWKNHLVRDLEMRDVPVVCVGGRKGRLVTAARNLHRLLRAWEADLVHAHLPTAGVLARIVSPSPVVYTEHNLAWSYRIPTRLANRLTYRRNTGVTAVSEAVAKSLIGFGGPAVEVVPNGVTSVDDPEAAVRARKELGLAENEPLVVHVGNIRPGKGHDLLLESVAQMAHGGHRVTVVSIGGEKHPGDLKRLRRRAKMMHLDDRIRFLGRRPDARSFIAAADVYVNPADYEGLPVSVLEAMAASRPVVATAVGGVVSIIQEGVTGRLVAPGSARQLADAICGVLADPEQAAAMGRRGSEAVAAEYGLESMIRRFEAIYRRVLA